MIELSRFRFGFLGVVLAAYLVLPASTPAGEGGEGTRITAATLRLGDANDPEERGWLVLEVEASLTEDEMERIYFEVEATGDDPYVLATGDFLGVSASGRALGVTYWAPEPEECGTTFRGVVTLVEIPEDDEEASATFGEHAIEIDLPEDFCEAFDDEEL